MAKITTMSILITLATHHQWNIHQLDVSNAFLPGSLTELVHMQQPLGFEDARYPSYVCRLHKSIYGLKQSPRQWFATLTQYL